MAQPLVEFLFNPASGGHAPKRIDAVVAALERRGARVRLTPTDGRSIRIDPAADRLCVAGGDGTIRLVIEALQREGRRMPIGILPAGTVNLLDREIGGSTEPDALAGRLLGTAHHAGYAVALGDTLFAVCASVSPEAWAVERVSSRLKRRIGRFAYAAALVPRLARWPRTPIRIDVDGRRLRCEAFYVAKGHYFAGRWVLSPEAALSEPGMRLILLRTARRRDMARVWLRLARHRPLEGLPFVETIACTAFEAAADTPLAVQADGDVVATLPARFELLPGPFAYA